jgi:hypothetical protein
MIGTRSWLAATTAVLATAIGLGPGGPRPELAIEAQRLVVERARTADAALESLQAELRDVLDVARDGAAAVVAGTDAPGPMLLEAADRLVAASPAARDAAASMAGLESARRAQAPDVAALPAGADDGSFEAIAAQLADAASVGSVFADMRRRAADVPVALGEALAALDSDDLAGAASAVGRARADHDAVAGWQVDYVTMPIWLETTDATIGAVERLVDAVERQDLQAADRAADDFAALADDAVSADRALQIAISEGGGAVATAPLSRLVDGLDAVDAQRAAVGVLLIGAGT